VTNGWLVLAAEVVGGGLGLFGYWLYLEHRFRRYCRQLDREYDAHVARLKAKYPAWHGPTAESHNDESAP